MEDLQPYISIFLAYLTISSLLATKCLCKIGFSQIASAKWLFVPAKKKLKNAKAK